MKIHTSGKMKSQVEYLRGSGITTVRRGDSVCHSSHVLIDVFNIQVPYCPNRLDVLAFMDFPTIYPLIEVRTASRY